MRERLGLCVIMILIAACNQQPSTVERSPAQLPQRPEKSRPGESKCSCEETIRRALKMGVPDGPRLAARAYDELFFNVSEGRLRELAKNPDPSIALQARWELRGKVAPRAFDPNHPDYLPGFLEGEFGLRPPTRWIVDIVGYWYRDQAELDRAVEFYRRAGCSMVGKKSRFEFTDGTRWLNTINHRPVEHRTSFGPMAPPDIEIREDGGSLQFQIKDQTVRMSRDLFPKIREDGGSLQFGINDQTVRKPGDLLNRWSLAPDRCNIAAATTPDTAFIAIYGDDFAPLLLLPIDRQTGRVRSYSDVWAPSQCLPQMGGSGYWYCEVELVCDANKVTVFGFSVSRGDYIESFDARTGENLLRFSTRYWGYREVK